MQLHWLARGLFLAVLGVAAGLGHAPIDWPVATIVALSLLFWIHRLVRDQRTALWHGWAFGVGYFAFTVRWIISPFLVHVDEDGWMAPFALILMASGMALYFMAASGVAHWIRPRSAVMFAFGIVAFEIVRALALTGFPWALLGHVLVETPFAQIAAYGGHFTLTAFVCLAALALLNLFDSQRILCGAFCVVATGLGIALQIGPVPVIDPDAPMVRLVQPNAPQDKKWDPDYSGVYFNRMLEFTGQGEVPDLVVWPESAIPDLLNYADDKLAQISDAARGAPVIVGVNRREGQRYYNSLVLLGRGGVVERLYDKRHLVPFGEYIPGGELLGDVGLGNFGASTGGGFSSGTTSRTMDVPGIGAIRPLICYEGIFANEIGADTRPRAMILITNDAWNGKDAGPLQHLAQARLRAIEQGMPMVRVANTGVSALIDAQGRLHGTIGMETAGYLDLPLPPLAPPTVYSLWGDWPFYTLLFLSLAAFLGFKRREIL